MPPAAFKTKTRTCRYDKNCLRSASVRDGSPGGVDDPQDLVLRGYDALSHHSLPFPLAVFLQCSGDRRIQH